MEWWSKRLAFLGFLVATASGFLSGIFFFFLWAEKIAAKVEWGAETDRVCVCVWIQCRLNTFELVSSNRTPGCVMR